MAASYALSWNRSAYWRKKLGKPQARGVSPYPCADYGMVEAVATHINSLEPAMACKVEVVP